MNLGVIASSTSNGPPQPVFVQSNGNRAALAGTGSVTATFTAAAANNLLVVVGSMGATSVSAAQLAMASSGYTAGPNVLQGGSSFGCIGMWWKKAAGGETSVQLNKTNANSGGAAVEVMEFSFPGATNWTVDTSTSENTATFAATRGPVSSGALAGASDVLVACLGTTYNAQTGGQSWTAGGLQLVRHGGGTDFLFGGYLLSPAQAGVNVTAAWTTSATSALGLMTFTPS